MDTKPPIFAWTTAFFMGAAFVVVPTIDANDPYLQPAQTAAERMAVFERQASQEAAELERQYQEMTDYETMRGVVYEPEGEQP